jgi:DNA-binding CsgD family transcriptional regulator
MTEKDTIQEFLAKQQKKLRRKKVDFQPLDALKTISLSPTQCLYVSNYKERKLTFQRGVKEFLGYSKGEFDHMLIHTFIHPDDIDTVQRLTKAAIAYVIDRNLRDNGQMFLTYRVRKKNGEYVKVMRQTNVFEKDSDGRFISNLSVLTDISFISAVNNVDWKFLASDIDAEEFKEYVRNEYQDFFSEREREIVELLCANKSSEEIAELLTISKHTVDTHRRKLLQKAKCKNTLELILFCQKNGLV